MISIIVPFEQVYQKSFGSTVYKSAFGFGKNIEKLSNTIAYAIDHIEESKMMAKNGQQYALQYLTSEINVDKIDNLYRSIISRGN